LLDSARFVSRSVTTFGCSWFRPGAMGGGGDVALAQPHDLRSRRMHRAVMPTQIQTAMQPTPTIAYNYTSPTNLSPSNPYQVSPMNMTAFIQSVAPSPVGAQPAPRTLLETRSMYQRAIGPAANEIKQVQPAVVNAVQKLKDLNETFVQLSSREAREQRRAERAATGEQTHAESPAAVSTAKLDNWGNGGSWQVCNTLPPVAERPMQLREFCLMPKTPTDPEVWLSERRMAVINTKGRKSSRDTAKGQDCFSLSHLPSGWEVLCVMDGHGPQGHWPAMRSCRTIPYFLRSRKCVAAFKQKGAAAALVDVFEKVHDDLKASAPAEAVDLQTSGCTAVCVMWREDVNMVWVATAGDSRAVLFSMDKGLITETRDHKGSDDPERQRIEACGGEVVTVTRGDGRTDCRVRKKGEEYPNIAMSRSLGDLCLKDYGLIAEPEVVGWERPSGGYVLAASDGVWEFMTTEEVVHMAMDILGRSGSHKDVCNEILQTSRKRWSKNVGVYCDDITVSLVSVSGYGAVGNRSHRPNVSCESACSVM